MAESGQNQAKSWPMLGSHERTTRHDRKYAMTLRGTRRSASAGESVIAQPLARRCWRRPSQAMDLLQRLENNAPEAGRSGCSWAGWAIDSAEWERRDWPREWVRLSGVRGDGGWWDGLTDCTPPSCSGAGCLRPCIGIFMVPEPYRGTMPAGRGSAQFGAKSAEIGPTSASLGPNPASVDRSRPDLDRSFAPR